MFAEPISLTLITFVQTRNPMGIWKQIAEYLYIKKRDPDEPRTRWMKYMHGMNRISLIMFIIAVLVIITRLIILPLFRK